MIDHSLLSEHTATLVNQAADWVRQAESLVIIAGAGMSADSGLPDFSDKQSIWIHNPSPVKRNFSYIKAVWYHHFRSNPELAWGLYGYRLLLCRRTEPHAGFQVLRKWGEQCRHGAFVYTTNVDGQFQKAGFSANQIVERRGSIHHLQCSEPCNDQIWSAKDFEPIVDTVRCKLMSPLPRCNECGNTARPNIEMNGDHAWYQSRFDLERLQWERWPGGRHNPLLIEISAGRNESWPGGRPHPLLVEISAGRKELRSAGYGWRRLIRINPDGQAFGNEQLIQLPLGALAGLTAIDAVLTAKQRLHVLPTGY